MKITKKFCHEGLAYPVSEVRLLDLTREAVLPLYAMVGSSDLASLWQIRVVYNMESPFAQNIAYELLGERDAFTFQRLITGYSTHRRFKNVIASALERHLFRRATKIGAVGEVQLWWYHRSESMEQPRSAFSPAQTSSGSETWSSSGSRPLLPFKFSTGSVQSDLLGRVTTVTMTEPPPLLVLFGKTNNLYCTWRVNSEPFPLYFITFLSLPRRILLIPDHTVADLQCRSCPSDPMQLELVSSKFWEQRSRIRPFNVHVLAAQDLECWNICRIRPGMYSRYFEVHACEVLTLKFQSSEDVFQFRMSLLELQVWALGISLPPSPGPPSGADHRAPHGVNQSPAASSIENGIPQDSISRLDMQAPFVDQEYSCQFEQPAVPASREEPWAGSMQNAGFLRWFRDGGNTSFLDDELPMHSKPGATLSGKTSHAQLTVESGHEPLSKKDTTFPENIETRRNLPDEAVTSSSTEQASPPRGSAEVAGPEVPNKDNDPMHVREDQISEELREDLRFEGSCWTCTPSDSSADGHMQIPLSIDGFPVVIPVRHHYPLLPLLLPPPDPHFKAISPTAGVSDKLAAEVFEVFTEALGFYLLINGYLQVIVPDDFDYETGLARLPAEFGRLKVSLISCSQSLYPTADHHEASAPAPSLTQGLDFRAQAAENVATASLAVPATMLRTDPPISLQPPLTLAFKEIHGSTVRPVATNIKAPKDRFEGKMGVLLAPNRPGGGIEPQKLMTLSTHVLSSFAASTKISLRESKDWISTIGLTSVSSGKDVSSNPKPLSHCRPT